MGQKFLQEELKLWKKGYKYVIGLDEAGRGSLAGPVVAAAVMIKNSKTEHRGQEKIPVFELKFSQQPGFCFFDQRGLFLASPCCQSGDNGFKVLGFRDSKKLSPKRREQIYKFLTGSPFLQWGIGKVSEKQIDKINILEATKLAMGKATDNLVKKIKVKNKRSRARKKTKPAMARTAEQDLFLIIDGNFKLDLKRSQKSIVKADEKVFSCAAASILAKVARDRIMEKQARKFPQYEFEKHKGYPTKRHCKKLEKYGPCPIHRKSFNPVTEREESEKLKA